MNAHIFDISTLIQIRGKVWIVSKKNPNTPILKIDQSDFNLIKKGVWKKTGTPLRISDTDYYIKNDLFESIKIKCKKMNLNITDLSFSMQEFMNPDIIKDLDIKIIKEHLVYLKNSPDDIYIICSKNTKLNIQPTIKKLEEYLMELGLSVKNYYFISETFYNRNEDKIAHKKIKVLLQHLIGLKTNNDQFTDEEVTQYDEVFFYEDDISTIKLTKISNDILKFLFDNSTDEIKEKINECLNKDLILNLNEVTYNKVNPFKVDKIKLTINKVFKTFESFNNFKRFGNC
jgi:hypothetical protein